MRPTFKLVSKYPVDIKAEETEENNYKVLFASADIQISQPITKDEYIEQRDTFYVSPSKAKNQLLDKLSFEGTGFQRSDFNFIDLIELSPEAEKALQIEDMNYFVCFKRVRIPHYRISIITRFKKTRSILNGLTLYARYDRRKTYNGIAVILVQ